MSIVLNANAVVNISIYYIEEKKKSGSSIFHFIDSAESLAEWKDKGYVKKEDVPPEDQAKSDKIIHTINTVWKRLTWKEQNALYSQSMKTVGNRLELDGIRYRELWLKTCLKNWDAKEDNGTPIPMTTESIDNLCPEVAACLLKNFERVTEPEQEE